MKCPVCNRKLFCTHEDYAGDRVLAEESLRCPCGYWEDFLYGETLTGYGPLVPENDWQDRFYRWLWQMVTFDGCITVKVNR